MAAFEDIFGDEENKKEEKITINKKYAVKFQKFKEAQELDRCKFNIKFNFFLFYWRYRPNLFYSFHNTDLFYLNTRALFILFIYLFILIQILINRPMKL